MCAPRPVVERGLASVFLKEALYHATLEAGEQVQQQTETMEPFIAFLSSPLRLLRSKLAARSLAMEKMASMLRLQLHGIIDPTPWRSEERRPCLNLRLELLSPPSWDQPMPLTVHLMS